MFPAQSDGLHREMRLRAASFFRTSRFFECCGAGKAATLPAFNGCKRICVQPKFFPGAAYPGFVRNQEHTAIVRCLVRVDKCR